MQDTEARLRRELEAQGGRVRQSNPDMLVLERVPTGKGQFSKAATNLLVACTPMAEMPYLVLVDQDLAYAGRDPFLHGVFRSRAQLNGWRPLLLAPEHFSATDLTGVARAALALLGFHAAPAGPLPDGLRDDWGVRESFPPLVGRNRLLERALAVLDRRASRAAPVFVGRSGCGKTALVRELAWRWCSSGEGRTACWADLDAIADEEKFRRLCEESLRLGPGLLVVVEMLPLACATVPQGEAFCRAVDEGLHVCATTTPEGLESLADPSLQRRLHALAVREPSAEAMAKRVLPAVARHLEIRHGVSIASEALHVAQRRATRRPGAEPGRSVALLESAVTIARQRSVKVLGPDDVLEV